MAAIVRKLGEPHALRDQELRRRRPDHRPRPLDAGKLGLRAGNPISINRPAPTEDDYTPMKPEQITEALEQAAAQLGIHVRYDTMTGDAAGGGGLCKLKGAGA